MSVETKLKYLGTVFSALLRSDRLIGFNEFSMLKINTAIQRCLNVDFETKKIYFLSSKISPHNLAILST